MTAETRAGRTESAVLAAGPGPPGIGAGEGGVDRGHVTGARGVIGLAPNPRRERLSIAAGEGGELRECTSTGKAQFHANQLIK